MDRAGAITGEDSKVLARWIALVPRKPVPGKLRVVFFHHPVPGDLGDHAGGGDAQADCIALDDRRVRDRERMHRQPVDQRVVRPAARGRRTARRIASWVARRMLSRSTSPADNAAHAQTTRGVARQFAVDRLPPSRGQFLGVVQVPVRKAFGQDDRRRHDGSRQRTASGLVDARDQPCRARFAQPRFVFQMRSRRPGRGRGVAASGPRAALLRLAHGHGLLALATAQVIELGAPGGALPFQPRSWRCGANESGKRVRRPRRRKCGGP